MQKYRAENIAERLVENKEKSQIKFKNSNKIEKEIYQDMRYPFIEYMSYILKRYGKKANAYLNILEEVVEKLGTTVSDVIKKEHFEIATQKVLIGNSITSIKEIQRINFLEIFEKINGVEEILKQDPAIKKRKKFKKSLQSQWFDDKLIIRERLLAFRYVIQSQTAVTARSEISLAAGVNRRFSPEKSVDFCY